MLNINQDILRKPALAGLLWAVLFLLHYESEAKSTFPGDRLEAACENYIMKNVTGDMEIECMQVVFDQKFEQEGVTARCMANKSLLRGLCKVDLEFHHNGRIIKRVPVAYRIKFFGQVPTALKRIAKGIIIESEDISLARMEVTNLSRNEIPTLQEIIGTKGASNISKGSIIKRSILEQEKLISRGDKVVIVVQTPSVRIRASGAALNDAAIGDVIRVIRDGGNNVLQGIVNYDGSIAISRR